ncbi:MAG: M43 family zinc metalloprotease [Bacteroidia bacterium]
MHQLFVKLLCCLFFCSNILYAQRACSEDAKGYSPTIHALVLEWMQSNNPPNPRGVEATQMNIPIVFHVVYNTPQENLADSFLISQVQVLNEDFQRLNADSINTPAAFDSLAGGWNVTFRLANVDPNGSPTNGIHRVSTNVAAFMACDDVKFSADGGADAWLPDYYLNIWVCNLGNGYIGQGQYPGGSPITDGIVLDYEVVGRNGLVPPYDKGRTATHELGHYFGLIHIWGANMNSCTSEDSISDTPSQYTATLGCPQGIVTDACTNGIMYMNYMDYTDDACMNLFTQQQISRMFLTLNAVRSSLINSFGYNDAQTSSLPSSQEKDLQLFLYPNPVQNTLQVEIKGENVKEISLTLTDALGKIYEKRNIPQLFSGDLQQFEVAHLASGLYFLQIETHGKKVVQKFVKG